ncbi:MAG: hypothetical protein KIS92_00280 [Planctomycetota bacterium]|nr:hypothetical protein [Planctomycetota bacterium]
MTHRTGMFLLLGCALLAAPAFSEEGKSEAKTEEAKDAPKGETKAFEFGDEPKRTVTVPTAWTKGADRPMRLATFSLPKAEGDAEGGELGFFLLPASGTVEANVERWAKQFGGKDSVKGQTKVKTADGTEATVVELEGEYTAMAFGGQKPEPKKDFKMFGAIIPAKEGQYFLKLTGPKKTVEVAKAAFEALVTSFK